MKLKFTSIKNAVQDFIQDTGIETEDEVSLLKWAHDAISDFIVDSQLSHRVRVLQVQNSNVELPDDFQILTQAAARIFPTTDCDCSANPSDPCCQGRGRTRIEKVVQWTQSSFEDDCDITIDLSCPRCGGSGGACSCSNKVMEVNVDRIWELSHPEYYYQHFNRSYRVGEGAKNFSTYHPKFEILRYSHSPWHQASQILPGCVNTQCPGCEHTFTIENGVVKLDFIEGELLLSYMGKPFDEYGNLMIPDHPKVHAALLYYLTYKHFLKEYFKGNDRAMSRYTTAKQEYREAYMDAISLITTPDYAEFKSWMEDNWFQRAAKTVFDHNQGNIDVYKGYKWAIDGATGIDPQSTPVGWNKVI